MPFLKIVGLLFSKVFYYFSQPLLCVKELHNDFIANTWKILLKIAINNVSHRETHEERVMHTISDNIEIMVNDKPDEVLEKLFSIISFQVSNWVGNINER